MALPRAIQKQVNEANQIRKAAYEPAPEGEELETLPPEPEPQNEPEPPAPEPEARLQDDDDKWETRYRVLQGKYNAEVPVLQRRNRELEERLSGLEELVSSMQTRTHSTADTADTAESDSSSVVSEEELADYGPDFMDMVGRVARQVSREEINRLNTHISELKSQLQSVGGKVQKSEQSTVYAQLDSTVENWRNINQSPDFLEWLAARDPFSGYVRRDMLQEAFNRADAPRVIAFFNGFLREHATVTESGTAGPGRKSDTRGKLDKLVAPGRQRTGSQQLGARDEKRVWTEAEIADAYRRHSRGEFRDSPDEWKKMEAEIFSAMRESRVQPNYQVPVSNAAY